MDNRFISARQLFSILLLGSIAQIAFAQSDSLSGSKQSMVTESGTSNRARERLTEEITVTEQLSVYRLREMTFDAEDKVYALFNELVDEKRFRITCDTEKRINSRFNYRECKPEFERRATSAEAQDHMAMWRTTQGQIGELPSGSVSLGMAVPQEFTIPRQHKELQQKMQTLAQENPEFLASLVKYVEAKQRLEIYERVDDSDD